MTQPGIIRDDYAGPGGWSEGLRRLGLHDVGLEWDAAACATRVAAGHATIRADLARYVQPTSAPLWGYIASPPCQTYSSAGKGAGRLVIAEVQALVRDLAHGRDTFGQHRRRIARVIRADQLATTKATRGDASAYAWRMASGAIQTARPMAVIVRHRPEWVCMEQVPAVLPVWRGYAEELRRLGYSVWCGLVNAADFGVPQTRIRAVLIASRTRAVTAPPPTHDRDPQPTLFGTLGRWVTMAEALGWEGEDTPARTVCGHRAPRWLYDDPSGARGRMVGFPRRDDGGGYRERDMRSEDEPAQTVTAKARSWSVQTGQRNGTVTPEPYERDTDEPAPTVTTRADQWTLNTGRDWKPGGSREDAQTIDPHAEPAPALTAKSGQQWQLNPGRTPSQPRRRPYTLDERAPTMAFGHDAASWAWERPSTTIVGSFSPDMVAPPTWRGPEPGPRQSQPGTVKITVQDALVLQSFDPTHPLQGSRTKQFEQVGNAVPPLLAAHVVSAATGIPLSA